MAAETKTGYLIEGTIYPMPELDSLNMGEAQILYDLSGISIEDLAPEDDETLEERAERVGERLRNPGFWRATMTIAYLREHPNMRTAQVVKLIDTVNQIAARETLAGDEEDPSEDPLASTNDHVASSPSEQPTSSENSGNGSSADSAPQDSPPVPTGTGESDTSSPGSDRLTAVN